MSLLMLAGNVTSVYHGTATMRNVTPAQLASEMNVGWNLGNSLDADGRAAINALNNTFISVVRKTGGIMLKDVL